MIKKNKKGFSLIEVMVAIGLTSAVVLVIMQAQKSSVKAVGDLEVASEINGLIQLITSDFSKPEVCIKNLQGKAFNGTTTNIQEIFSAGGKKLLEKNKKYGTKIDNIDDIVLVSDAATRVATLKITYTPHIKPVQQQTFQVQVNVNTDAAGTTIDTCFSDEYTALRDAVSSACQGAGATYLPASGTYGTCEHTVQMLDSADTPLPTFRCPNGEALAITQTGPHRILKCQKISTVGTCGTWEYMNGIDAAGVPQCSKILDLFGVGATGIMATTTSSWQVIPISCPAGKILLSIGAGFTPNCIDPKITTNCPAGQILMGVTDTPTPGTLVCGSYSSDVPCAGGSFLRAVTSAGVVTCAYPTLSGSCTRPQVVNGTTAGGAVTCVTVPN